MTRSRSSASTTQRELCALHVLRDLGHRSASSAFWLARLPRLVALGQQGPQALDRALDARRDLAGLLVAGRFGELGAGVGQRAQRIPSRHDMARRARHGVEGDAQFLRRGLQLLGQQDLLLTPQGACPADLLEVRFQRPSLPARIELLIGRRGCPRQRAARTLLFVERFCSRFSAFTRRPLGPPVHSRFHSDTARGGPVSSIFDDADSFLLHTACRLSCSSWPGGRAPWGLRLKPTAFSPFEGWALDFQGRSGSPVV